MRVATPRTLFVGTLVGGLLACGGLLGIEDLSVQDIESFGDGGGDTDPPQETSASTDASDASVDADAGDRDAGVKLVFVTSDRSNGAMGGVNGADGRCRAAAERGGLDAGFVAWVSARGSNAIDRIEHGGAYRLLDGRLITKDREQLKSGSLESAIDVDEMSEPITGDKLVWTGTFPNGQTSATCVDWSNNGPIAYGAAGSLDRPKLGAWTDNGGPAPASGFPNWGCQASARLYCFER